MNYLKISDTVFNFIDISVKNIFSVFIFVQKFIIKKETNILSVRFLGREKEL